MAQTGHLLGLPGSNLDPQKVLIFPLGRQLTLDGLKGTVSFPSPQPPGEPVLAAGGARTSPPLRGAERQEGRAGLLPACPRLSPGETVIQLPKLVPEEIPLCGPGGRGSPSRTCGDVDELESEPEPPAQPSLRQACSQRLTVVAHLMAAPMREMLLLRPFYR